MFQAPISYFSLPRWMLEGGAHWSQGAATYHQNFSDYLEERKRNTGELFSNPSIYTAQWLAEFLNPNPATNWAYWATYENYRLYDVGLLATEALVALKGPETFMHLYTDVGSGQSFLQAFEKEYGLAWSEAVSIIAQTIEAEINS